MGLFDYSRVANSILGKPLNVEVTRGEIVRTGESGQLLAASWMEYQMILLQKPKLHLTWGLTKRDLQ
jgi:hypothetical protein